MYNFQVPIVINRLKAVKDLKDLSQPAVQDFLSQRRIQELKATGNQMVETNVKRRATWIVHYLQCLTCQEAKQTKVLLRKVSFKLTLTRCNTVSDPNYKNKFFILDSKKIRQCLKPSSFKLNPLTLSAQVRLMLRYLTPLGEYQEV